MLKRNQIKSDISHTEWDRMNNRRFEERLPGQVTGSPGDTMNQADTYTYNSIYQLTKVHYGVPSSQLTMNNNTVTPFTPATFNRMQDYSLDGVLNRSSLTETGATPKTVTYFMNSTNPPADRQVNQYTTVTTNSTPAQQTHDENGNNIFDGINTYRFNYLNQLTEIIKPDGSRTVYRYDALGRRTSKKSLNQYGYEVNFINSTTSQILYFSERANELEEFKADNTLQKRYIYGIMIDEVLAADIGSNRFFYHDNSLGSVAAITNSTEILQESYKFDVYGEETIFNASNAQIAQSIVGNPYRFTGRRKDFEEQSMLYYYRARYYKPETGRFVQRDPMGIYHDIFRTYLNRADRERHL